MFLAEVRPTINDYWRTLTLHALAVRPSNNGCITTNKQQVSPNDDFTPTARTTAKRRVINTDQTTASALGTTASPDWIGEGPTDAVPPPSSTPPATRLRYLHQYQPNHPPVFAQDDSVNHVTTTYQKLGNGKNVGVRGTVTLGLYTIYPVV